MRPHEEDLRNAMKTFSKPTVNRVAQIIQDFEIQLAETINSLRPDFRFLGVKV